MLVVAAARPAPPGAVTLSVADAPGRLELRPDARYVVNLQRDSGATRGGVACFVEQPLPLTHWVGGCAGAASLCAHGGTADGPRFGGTLDQELSTSVRFPAGDGRRMTYALCLAPARADGAPPTDADFVRAPLAKLGARAVEASAALGARLLAPKASPLPEPLASPPPSRTAPPPPGPVAWGASPGHTASEGLEFCSGVVTWPISHAVRGADVIKYQDKVAEQHVMDVYAPCAARPPSAAPSSFPPLALTPLPCLPLTGCSAAAPMRGRTRASASSACSPARRSSRSFPRRATARRGSASRRTA